IRRSRSLPCDVSSASVSSIVSALPDSARTSARRRDAGAPAIAASLLRYPAMKIVALAGGVGAGKFLRGVSSAAPGSLDAVVVNTADDIERYGLHISPDVDSVCYWLSGMADRERGWGLADETF